MLRFASRTFIPTMMRATVSAFNLELNNYQARTENEIALSFAVVDGTRLKLNEELDIELTSLLVKQCVTRAETGVEVEIRIGPDDLHDLRMAPVSHGDPRTPSLSRLSEA